MLFGNLPEGKKNCHFDLVARHQELVREGNYAKT